MSRAFETVIVWGRTGWVENICAEAGYGHAHFDGDASMAWAVVPRGMLGSVVTLSRFSPVAGVEMDGVRVDGVRVAVHAGGVR